MRFARLSLWMPSVLLMLVAAASVQAGGQSYGWGQTDRQGPRTPQASHGGLGAYSNSGSSHNRRQSDSRPADTVIVNRGGTVIVNPDTRGSQDRYTQPSDRSRRR